jgi:hypothetical protein
VFGSRWEAQSNHSGSFLRKSKKLYQLSLPAPSPILYQFFGCWLYQEAGGLGASRLYHHGCFCGSEDASANKIPPRVQPKGGHEKSQRGSHEEVRFPPAHLMKANRARLDGLQARSLTFWDLRMTLLLSFVSTL